MNSSSVCRRNGHWPHHSPTREGILLRSGVVASLVLLSMISNVLFAGEPKTSSPSPTGAIPINPKPLAAAHAHNDYEHERPLFEALEAGFCNVEADIHLVGGKLLVGHDASGLSPTRTLEKLYLDPLRARVRANGGQVYPTPAAFTLLIDIKTTADPTYKVLRTVLRRYRDILTRFEDGRIHPGPITVVISGERPIEWVRSERTRWCAMDGRLEDLDTNPPVSLFPWISASWVTTFRYRGVGPLSADEEEKLFLIVTRCHAQGRRLRFWATGDDPQSWGLLKKAGTDILNADDLKGLQQFLLKQP